ncbi:MAG TPA: hypothetical protein PLS94_13565, partial [Prolixibacteraceae bacterium]|nr:hypothetical protein [Prolixibacteraceae bacterium]
MTQFQLIVKSFRHYFKSNLWVALGIAITTAVLAGGLIVGDSVKHSLFQAANLRLGNITHALTSGNRYFTVQLSERLIEQGIESSALLKLEAIASTSGGQLKLNKVNVWGIDDKFTTVTGSNTSTLNTDFSSVSISKNIAQRLNLTINDEILLRITKASLIPANAPFVSDNDQTITYRTKVAQILDETQMGRINLQHSQTAPFNIFMPIDELNRLMDTENKANTILLSTPKNNNEIENAIRLSYSLADAQLSIVEAAATGQWELRSERVFIDDATYAAVQNTGVEYTPILTYFSNYFRLKGKETPYSFISSLPENQL